MKSAISVLFFLFPLCAFSRWVEPAEVASKVNFEKVSYHVRADGTYEVTVERQTEIVKDNARNDMGLTRVTNDARSATFELLEAKTVNPGGVVPVRKEHIETKPLASLGPGFDEQVQLTIAYPQVEVGSKLYYKYRRDVKKAQVRGLFSATYPLGWAELLEKEEISFESEVPLYWETLDKEGLLEVESSGTGPWKLSFRLKKPAFRQIVQEERTQIPTDALPWISVSTAPNWKSFPEETPLAYEKVIHSELPKRFLPLLEKAKEKTSPLEQIDTVTSGLQELVRYVGDWQQVDGAYHPRALQLVADTGFGDCKDYASATAALLTRLGFTAHAAWVLRGGDLLLSPERKIPAPDFNHAIVRAEKNGKVYWIDPTNTQSFARAVFSDISDRPAFVLRPGAFALERTPAMDPADSSTSLQVRVKLGKAGEAKSEGELRLSGRAALSMTAQGLSLSKSQLDYSFLAWITDPTTLESWKFSDYDLRSRIVSDIGLRFTFGELFYPLRTTAGEGYSLPRNPYLDVLRARLAERAGDLLLEDPNRWRRTYTVSGKGFVFRRGVSCEGKSPWIDWKRNVRLQGGAVVATDEVTLRRARVPAREVAGEAFGRMVRKLFTCLQSAVAVY